MKKITLFALAAMTASSAFAAFPQLNAARCATKKSNLLQAPVEAAAYVKEAKAFSRADAEAQPSELPTYCNEDAMYLGSRYESDGYIYSFGAPFGFVPSKGSLNFYPFYKADAYSWEYLDVDGTQNSSERILSVSLSPFKQFTGPTLNLTTGSDVISYNDSVSVYFAGGYPSLYNANMEGFGLSPVKFSSDFGSAGLAAVSYAPAAPGTAQMYNTETGTYLKFGESTFLDEKGYTDYKLTGFGSVVPGSSAPFILKGASMFIYAETKEAIELKVSVMSIGEDGNVNFADTIGVGSIILAEGLTAGTVDFSLSAVDNILGLSTDEPIVVPSEGVYLSIGGVNDPEKITIFKPFYNFSESQYVSYAVLTSPEYKNAPIYSYLIGQHAYMEYAAKDVNGDEVSGITLNYGLYIPSDAPEDDDDTCMRAFEYWIFYDVEYPYIANATEGFESGDMTIEIPVEGGFTNRYFEANQDIIQLIDDEYVTVEESGDTDWYVFDTEAEEGYEGVFNLLIEAEPLPEGVEGRKATITFSGYGFDNTITIVQGTPASINEVVAAKAKNGKVYDLQGRVVTKATKGIYIVDGKKVVL